MKKIVFVFVFILCASTTNFCQDIVGKWTGILKVQGSQLAVVFNISKTAIGYSATMDSPDQNAYGILVDTIGFENSTLNLRVVKAGIEYKGVLGKDAIIVGSFKQGGQVFSLNLSKGLVEKDKIVRSQEPKKPYPYHSEEVSFVHDNLGIKLAGTLTLPKKEGVFPAVILVSGSGPQNRDEELMGHKPFLVLSDYLTKNGIAVLRFDDRGTASSEGDFKSATSMDFATDVEAAVKFLLSRKEIDKQKIGLIGHSEGGMIAPIVANRTSNVAFIVLLAGVGISGYDLLLLQQELIGRAMGIPEAELQSAKASNAEIFRIVVNSTTIDQLKIDLTNHMKQNVSNNPTNGKPEGMSDDDFVKIKVNQIATIWMQYFIKFNPVPVLEKVKCPVLALNGEKDLQVPPKENLEAIQSALSKGGNKKVTTKVIPNLNHLFQECQTGSPQEYSQIDQTFSPIAMNEILQWIQAQKWVDSK